MKAVEAAVAAELRDFPDEVRTSAVATAALELARRLDSGPGDRESVLLARELRQSMNDLHARAPTDMTDHVEAFLERIAVPDLGHTAH